MHTLQCAGKGSQQVTYKTKLKLDKEVGGEGFAVRTDVQWFSFLFESFVSHGDPRNVRVEEKNVRVDAKNIRVEPLVRSFIHSIIISFIRSFVHSSIH